MFRLTLILSAVLVQAAVVSAQDGQARRKQREAFAKLQELAGPGEDHARLKKLVGTWKVEMQLGDKDGGFDGQASSSMILGDRFLVIDGSGSVGKRGSAFRYTIGFDRRHDQYVLILMDTAGTYHVSARGEPTENGIRMFGTDDDPQMKKMGFVKKFGFDLEIRDDDQFSITTIFVDTRTEEETLRPAFKYVFTRSETQQ